MVDLVERGQRHAAAQRIEARRLRGRHADHLEPGGDALAEQLDEMLCGRAGTEPEPHAVPDVLKGARRSLPLQLVHVHDAPASELRVPPVLAACGGLCSLVFPVGTGLWADLIR